MQVNSTNNVSFGAKILKSNALTSAINVAKKDYESGTKEGIKRASEFYNYLRTMENDKSADYFFIDTNPYNYYPYMRLGRNTRLLEFFGNSENDLAHTVIRGVKKLVEGKYLKTEIADEAKGQDLFKAFDKWI